MPTFENLILRKLAPRPPLEFCREAGLTLEPEGAAILKENPSPSGFVARLVDEHCYSDAVRYLAHALPRRETVWWGCLCVRMELGASLSEEEKEVLSLAEAWVREPTAERARKAGTAARTRAEGTAAQMVALGAFFSGENISLSPEQTLAPPPHATGALIGGAVVIAATRGHPAKMAERYRDCIAKGIELARGKGTAGQ